MKRILRRVLLRPVMWLANRYSSRPDKLRVHKALSDLHEHLITNPGEKGLILSFEAESGRFIIFSDQHKGAGNGADDFAGAEKNYLAAMRYYLERDYTYINLGDCEELWENSLVAVKKANVNAFEAEKAFFEKNAYIKVFGNHDLYWDNDPLAGFELEKIFGKKVPIYEGVILQAAVSNQPLQFFLTHGHQGDTLSDGNLFSKWFVANIWAPLQSYLGLNPNTPAYDDHLKTTHNKLMYEWAASQDGLVLITGHTHQPVFESLTFLERLYKKLGMARASGNAAAVSEYEQLIKLKKISGETMPDFTAYKQTYFNTGCCCFSDGDVTGIEIADGYIRLVKWEYTEALPKRVILEELALESLIQQVVAASAIA
ncbi:metallophosphoesterase [Segetibacter sp. 3557_3]|uniref:metallophosphoesterase n=1 Tax=Segetibacter sp. 3557_3 TaxID=2547429 RepID=UPI0010585DD3|nr:metallophosphoesterase [Segetibacter sp. 3557_3]TDH26222.1 metallophosphoesterase [Segetibacter sp. 3557_3]